jgi:hypothetical protein
MLFSRRVLADATGGVGLIPGGRWSEQEQIEDMMWVSLSKCSLMKCACLRRHGDGGRGGALHRDAGAAARRRRGGALPAGAHPRP